MNFIKQNSGKLLWGIVIASFLVSIVHSFYFRIEPTVDAGAYDRIAINVLNGHGYRQNFDLPFERDNSIGRVGPGYEFFLVGVYYIFGHHYEAVWILQAIFHALSVLLVFLIAMCIFVVVKAKPPAGGFALDAGTRKTESPAGDSVLTGLIASALFGFYPDLIIGSSMLLAETLAIFLMLVSIYIFFRIVEKTSGVHGTPDVEDKRNVNTHLLLTILLGAFFAFSVLVRTPLLLIIIPIIYFLYSKKLRINLAILLVVIAAVMTPWTIRNFEVYGAFIPTSLTFGDDLLSGNHPGSSGELDDTRIQFTAKYNDYDMVTADRLAAKEAIWFILTNPLEFLKITLYRVSMYFSFVRPTGWWPYLYGSLWQPLLIILSSFWSALIFIFGFLGIVEFFHISVQKTSDVRGGLETSGVLRTPDVEEPAGAKKAKYLLAFLIAVILPAIFIVVETRYRYPSYPFLAMFAGFGLVELIRYFKESALRSVKIFLIVFMVLMGNTIFDITRNFDRILERISVLM